MTTPSSASATRMSNYENKSPIPDDSSDQVKVSKWTCCSSSDKKPNERRRHSRKLTQHEIDYTIQLRAKAVLKADKRKVHVLSDVTQGTDGKLVKVEIKKTGQNNKETWDY